MIQLRLFGRPEMVRDDAPPEPLERNIISELLIFIADMRDVSRDKLCSTFWPDSDDERARHALSQALSRLRKTHGECIVPRGERVVLHPSIHVDTHLFAQLVSARDARALHIYRGPFAEEWSPKGNEEFENWMNDRRTTCEAAYRRSVIHHVRQLTAAGEHEAAHSCIATAISLAPNVEDLRVEAIEMAIANGAADEALMHYEQYREYCLKYELKPLDTIEQKIAEVRAQASAHSALKISAKPVTENPPAPAPAANIPKPAWWRSRRMLAAAALALVLFSAGILTALSERNVNATADAGLLPDMVAILPFAELASADRLAGADSLRLRLAADLRRNPQMQIADLAKTDHAARQHAGLQEIAASLKSLVLVGGSLTSADSTLTFALQVWDGGTGAVIKAKRWQLHGPGQTAGLSEEVASYLNTQLLQFLRILAHRRETRSAAGWTLFNGAWQHYRNSADLAENAELEGALRVLGTADSLAIAAEHADPDWIAPTLLRGHIARRVMMWSRHPAAKRTPAEVMKWAEAAIAQGDRALERVPGSIDALELRGIAKYEYWTYLAGEQMRDDHALLRSAERDLQDVAAADAQRSQARVYLADIFHSSARFKEEKAMALLALDADPIAARDPKIMYRIALASFYLDQPSEALRMCRQGQQRYPAHTPFRYCELFVLAHADNVPADVARAWQIVNDLAQPANAPPQRVQVPLFRMLAANVIARAGLRDSAQAVLARASAEAPGSISLMAPEASAWTRLGNYERALDILEKNAKLDPVWIKTVLLNPALAPLRQEPRFENLKRTYLRSY